MAEPSPLIYNLRAAVEVARSSLRYTGPDGSDGPTQARYAAALKNNRACMAGGLLRLDPVAVRAEVAAVLKDQPGLDLYTLVSTVYKKLKAPAPAAAPEEPVAKVEETTS